MATRTGLTYAVWILSVSNFHSPLANHFASESSQKGDKFLIVHGICSFILPGFEYLQEIHASPNMLIFSTSLYETVMVDEPLLW
jgi:hypothetical protein